MDSPTQRLFDLNNFMTKVHYKLLNIYVGNIK
jgi:hypothetical protein